MGLIAGDAYNQGGAGFIRLHSGPAVQAGKSTDFLREYKVA